ncbi:hypothetical protein ABZX30_24540 [Streptomyces sp. NPDC004542]|uniref:hypothetical protein n=1 Tax=Streptomyces sp. NPDC004542 TaxID=3154281 RepID=UPI0033A7158E
MRGLRGLRGSRGRQGLRSLAVSGLAGLSALAGAGAAWAGDPSAGLAYHGSAMLAGGQVDVWLTPRNDGPAAVPDASVRLRWSAALADVQQLPAGCARTEERAVVCRTGALAAHGLGEQIALSVRLEGRPPEVTMEVETAWTGGAAEPGKTHEAERVLVLATGDPYAF